MVAVALPMGLTLDEIVIQGESLHLETSPFQISLAKPGSLEARISPGSLAEFLNKKAPANVSDISVKFVDGHIQVDAKFSMIISIGITATCKIRIEDDQKLFVDLVKMDSIAGTGASNILQKQLDSMNPVIDVQDLPFIATLSTVEITAEWCQLRGTIAPSA